MDDRVFRLLVKFYDSYRYHLEARKKLSNESVLLSCIKLFKNDRFRPLKESALSTKKVPASAISELREQGLIRQGMDVSTYVITGRGIWQVEKAKGYLNEEKLVEFLDANFFGLLFEDIRPLNDRDKVVIFALLSARAFSDDSAVDMKRDDIIKNTWLQLFKECSGKLREYDAIEQTDDELFPTSIDYEDPASHFIRHSDGLARKTKAIYVTSSKRVNRYYLDVGDPKNPDKDRIAYLFWLVFGERLDSEGVYSVFEFSRSVAYDYGIRVFEHEKHIFASPSYDDVMRESIIESVVSRQKWQIN